ncbi:MAG: DUF4286 family protein [Ferruginibacter sp.]
MFIYNVTAKLDKAIANDWLAWMRTEHMPEVLGTKCFHEANILKLLEVDDTDGPTYAAQYVTSSRHLYDQYITNHAGTMRQKAFAKWGNQFIAFRSLMQVVN